VNPSRSPDAQQHDGHQPAAARIRFHWDTPLFFSPTDPGVLFVAGNKLFRSTDRGDSLDGGEPDLTSGPDRAAQMIGGVRNDQVRVATNDGIVCWPCIVAAQESPKQAGIYYTGTDDGVVSVSKDGGKTGTRRWRIACRDSSKAASSRKWRRRNSISGPST
jgi:hypothetical protein